MDLHDYQVEAQKSDRSHSGDLKSIMVPLLGLAGETGSLLTEYKKWLREGDRYKVFTDQVSEELGDILWYVSNIATKLNLDLDEVAQENLAKLSERWPNTDTVQQSLFTAANRYDSAFPPDQQLPIKIRVEFREVPKEGATWLQLTYNGKSLGDPLTDNAYVNDGYRYHDVFHLTNAIMLGWSPVTRKLLGVKRKKIPQIDEVEDGARAAATEEGISAFIFGYAKDYSFFEGCETIDYDLLRTVKMMVRPYEVRDRSNIDWEHTILSGYAVWRSMFKNQGGVFVGDAETGKIEYQPLPI
mgnify:CR=1 FL=1